MREVVAAHLVDCQQCALQLAEFENYTSIFQPATAAEGTGDVMGGASPQTLIGNQAGQPSRSRSPRAQANRSWMTSGRLAFAASVLLVLGFGYWMTHPSASPILITPNLR